MSALQTPTADFAGSLVDQFAKAHPFVPFDTAPNQPTMRAAPPEGLGTSIIRAPGRIAGSLATELIVSPAQHLNYGLSRMAGAVGLTGFAKDLQADADRIGRQDSRTTLGQLGRDSGAATFVGHTAGTVAKWMIPAIGATDTFLSAHERTFKETGSDAAALGSGFIEMATAFAGFGVAKKFGPEVARSIGAMVKSGEWIPAARAIGRGVGIGSGVIWVGMAADEMQKAGMGTQTAEQAFENIKSRTLDTIESGALGSAMMTGGAALHAHYAGKVKAATNVGQLGAIVQEVQTISEMPKAKIVEMANTSPPPVENIGEAPATITPNVAIGAASAEELRPGPTGVKNASTAVERERRDLPPAVEPIPETIQQWDEAAKDRLKRNPNAGDELVQEVLTTPRPITDIETAVLLNHQTAKQAELQQVQFDLFKAEEAGDTAAAADLKVRESRLSDDLLDIYDAAKYVGTQWGRGGVARQMLMREDYSLAGMETRQRAAVGGRQLTDAEKADLKNQHAAIAASDSLFQEHVNAQETANAERQTTREFQRIAKSANAEEAAATPAKTPEELTAGLGETVSDAELSSLARALAKHFIRQGVTERGEIVAKVHEVIKGVVPDITPRQVQDAISLYGKYKLLNKDPVAVKLREIAGELQQVSKLQDMEAGQAPLKTGVERRTPTDEERRLIKEVNEKKKAAGFTVTDPARQLQTALGAVKTRLRNAITDLKKALDTRTAMLKGKRVLKYDEEAIALRKQRDELKAQYDEIFLRRKATDEQRRVQAIAAVERQLKELERRIATHDFSTETRTPIMDAQLEALKAKRKALGDQYLELKSLDPASMRSAAERSNLQYIRFLSRRIESLKERMAKHDYHKKVRETSRVLTPEGQKLFDENARLKGEFQEAVARSRKLTSDREATDAIRAQIASGNIVAPSPRAARRKLSPEERRSGFDLKEAKRVRDELLENRKPKGLGRIFVEALGLPRQLAAGLELSPVLRQGVTELFSRPLSFIQKVAKTLPSVTSAEAAHKIDTEIAASPNAPLYRDAGLRIYHSEQALVGGDLALSSSWVNSIWGLRNFNRFSRVFLNSIRASRFDAMLHSRGIDPYSSPEAMQQAKQIAMFINESTGAGGLGRFEPAAAALNTYLFSARFAVSRFQYLTGHSLLRADPQTRRVIAIEYARQLIGITAFYSMAHLAGAKIGGDPTSSDFGKIIVGNTRIDPMGGLLQATVLASRLTEQSAMTIRSDKRSYKERNGREILQDFFSNKLAPIPASMVNFWAGSNSIGEPVTLTSELPVPITYRDIYEALQDQGVGKGAALGIAAFFGVGLQTYKKKQSPGREAAPLGF